MTSSNKLKEIWDDYKDSDKPLEDIIEIMVDETELDMDYVLDFITNIPIDD